MFKPQDKQRSESLDAGAELLRLNRLVRSAIGLIKGIEVNLEGSHFHLHVVSVVSWFKVKERYALGGAVSHAKRRDLRRGLHRGKLAATPDGRLLLQVRSGDGGCVGVIEPGVDSLVLLRGPNGEDRGDMRKLAGGLEMGILSQQTAIKTAW